MIYCKKNLIVTNENKKDKKIEAMFNAEKLTSSLITKFFKPKTDTAPRVGIDSKKDIFAESILLNFSILAAVIVIPDLLTPGIKDKIWKTPMNAADL